MPTGLHGLLVGAIDYWHNVIVNCRRHGNGSEVQSHDEGKGWRSVTRVHRSVMGVQNESVTEGMEKRVHGHKSVPGAWLLVFYNVWCILGR